MLIVLIAKCGTAHGVAATWRNPARVGSSPAAAPRFIVYARRAFRCPGLQAE